MSNNNPISVFWFRRDLRLEDNAGLYYALKSGIPVLPVFVFDTQILSTLEDKNDKRVSFIYHHIKLLKEQLNSLGSDLHVAIGSPQEVWQKLFKQYPIKQVFYNHDYEPQAKERDLWVNNYCEQHKAKVNSYKDQCIFEFNEVLKDDGSPYTVFTPYSNKWKAKLNNFFLTAYPTEKYFNNLISLKTPDPLFPITQIGFNDTECNFPSKKVAQTIIKNYHQTRDFPAMDATSKLGVHFRFGTISIREKARKALAINATYLNELIWRDFYMMILANFPHVANEAFKKQYNLIPWRNNEIEFEAWCNGQTGYPIVDAGMRQLNQTGYMHNRVRMIVASFLTKHLLIDWRWGEAYFAQKLLDFDLSANNGGWQWAAGCGTDAAPYFRVFNPALQTQKFDSQLQYIKKWLPEFNTPQYVKPIVQHEVARERCLQTYKSALAAR